jgi:hypothetical protein
MRYKNSWESRGDKSVCYLMLMDKGMQVNSSSDLVEENLHVQK